jgi:signal transduction histidine kinase
MFRSLLGRLLLLLLLLVVASIAAGALMWSLFRQSATAQTKQAQAEIGRACDGIGSAYRFYTAGWHGRAASTSDASFRSDLGAVVQTALRDRAGVEGGIWQDPVGSLAYAFPTYQGSGPKTDFPEAERGYIQAVNRTALTEERSADSRYSASSQILLVTACPLAGPVPHLTAWTMTRVHTFAGRGYQQLMAGLLILFGTVVAAAVLLIHLTVRWTHHVGRIETALKANDVANLPTLAATGELELDRVVMALNEAGRRLADARQQADRLAREVANGQRLAAIGRVAAGMAHEIRNPIGAMKLKAEGALVADADRKDQALSAILGQIERLDGVLRRLLSVTEQDKPSRSLVPLGPFLMSCIVPHEDLARSRGISLIGRAPELPARFDSEQMRRAIENLILNAIEAAPEGSCIAVEAQCQDGNLIFSVHDEGAGAPASIREHLFEPFVSGRPGGTGLGLSIVREVAVAHAGTARLGSAPRGTVFEIVIPCQPS